MYAKYEEETHKQIKELIAKVEDIPHEVRSRKSLPPTILGRAPCRKAQQVPGSLRPRKIDA